VLLFVTCYNFIRRDLSWNWISNLLVRLAAWTLGNWKPKNSWHSLTLSMLLVLNNYIKNLLITKWREAIWCLLSAQACRPYSICMSHWIKCANSHIRHSYGRTKIHGCSVYVLPCYVFSKTCVWAFLEINIPQNLVAIGQEMLEICLQLLCSICWNTSNSMLQKCYKHVSKDAVVFAALPSYPVTAITSFLFICTWC